MARWRGRIAGWRYQYVPESLVRHEHAASSKEGSALFTHYVERNRFLTLARNASYDEHGTPDNGSPYGGNLKSITAPDAQWSVLEGKWGLVPDMSGVRTLAQQLGLDVAKRLTMTGETVWTLEFPKESGLYKEPRGFNPCAVTVAPDGSIFVADGYGSNHVLKFGKNGRFIKSAGTRGNGPLQFSTPHGISADAQGNLYIADRDNHRDRHDPAVPPRLHVGRVQPDIGPFPLDRPAQEALHPFVDLAAQPGDLALADPLHPHGLDQIIHRAGRDTLDVSFLDHRGERLLGRASRLQERGEIAAFPELRDLQLDRADARLPGPLAIAIAMIGTRGRALAVRRPGQALHLHVHHAVGDVGHHLPEEIVVRTLLNEGLQGHSVDRHGQSPVAFGVRNPSQLRF